MQKLLKTYQKRLTNLSNRNKSLLLMRTSKNYFFDFENLDFALNKSAYEVLAEVFSGKKGVKICQRLDARDEKSNALSHSLLQLFRTDQLIQAERGAMDLQLGFPYLKGKFNNENSLRCPLLFLPIKLLKGEKYWELERNGEIQFNTSFLLAYQQFNGVKLKDEFIEEDFQEFSSDLGSFLLELYEFLKNSPLELNFNTELFGKKLRHFENFTKDDLSLLQQGELKLFPQAILGIFPQAGSFLAQDYALLLEQKGEEFDLENFFHSEFKAEVRERDLHLPLAVDASQEEVIKRINQGASVVVQGPPGSGKSQLIANIMADYAAKGKKVLLVCQKRAALDMVYKRLSEVGMGSFAGLVHDFKNDRKELFQKIQFQINSIEQYRKDNYNLDAIFLEREFDLTSIQIEKICEELSTFKTALFDESKFGKSVKELYLLASEEGFANVKAIDLSWEAALLDYEQLQKLKAIFEKIGEYEKRLDTPSQGFWKKRINTKTWTEKSKKNIAELISKAFILAQEIKIFGLNDPERKDKIFSLFHKIKSHSFVATDLFKPNSETDILTLSEAIFYFSQHEYIFGKFDKTNLNILSKQVDKAVSLQKSSLKFAWYKLWNEDWKKLQKWLTDTDLGGLSNKIKEYQSLVLIKKKFDFKTLSEGQEVLSKSKEILALNRELLSFGIPDIAAYRGLEALINSYLSVLKNLQKYFEIKDLNSLLQLDEHLVLSYLGSHFDLMIGQDELLENLTVIGKGILTKSRDPLVIELSVLHGFIAHLEDQEPLLRGVSSLKISQLSDDLQLLIEKKKALSQENLLIQLKETTYRHIDKNRLGNTTTYRELGHQVSKKRRIWPIRKVLEQFNEELFRLIPCWMASPETVSAIFPIERYFDLVIFDEASQCFAENGLPAMLRGQQVLVAGDSKQLQPNDLYRVRYEEEENEEYLTEIDSLLHLSSQFLPNHLLRGHYRSKSLELIGFSNKHFYDGDLQLIPHFDVQNDSSTAIDFIKVEGLWEQQKNEVEAQKVKELCSGLIALEPNRSIGVVTFNHNQAKLIQDLVDEPKVSVKNIENIQGDEFDILIFSVAYAPDVKGKLRFQFGTLGMAGGENRLNVAITRAREKVIVVSSIHPEQLQVESATNLGPKLLKEYLSYAKRISEGTAEVMAGKETKSFANKLSAKLMASDSRFTADLPYVDLAVKKDGIYSSLLLTDDNLLYQSISTKEAFAYHPLALKDKSWTVDRAWSRNYWLKLE